MTLKEKRLGALRETRSMWSDIHKDRHGRMYYEVGTNRFTLGTAACPLCKLIGYMDRFNTGCIGCPVRIVFGTADVGNKYPCVPLISKIRVQRTNAKRVELALVYINKMIRHVKQND